MTALPRRATGENLGYQSGTLRRCPLIGCHDPNGTPRALADNHHLCPPCINRVTRLIDKTPVLFQALRGREKTQQPGDAGPVAGTKTPGTSLDLHAAYTATRLADTLQDVARVALILAGIPATGTMPTREQWRIDNSLVVLSRHGKQLWAHPYYGPENAHLILTETRKAWVALGYGHGRSDLKHPCPQCGMLTLSRYSGHDDYVTCRWCHLVWDRAAYATILQEWAKEYQATQTLTPQKRAHP